MIFNIRGVKNIMEPVHRIFKLLVLHKTAGHHQRRMKKQLPVIDGVRPAKREIHGVSVPLRIGRFTADDDIRARGIGTEIEIIYRWIGLRLRLYASVQHPIDAVPVQLPDKEHRVGVVKGHEPIFAVFAYKLPVVVQPFFPFGFDKKGSLVVLVKNRVIGRNGIQL